MVVVARPRAGGRRAVAADGPREHAARADRDRAGDPLPDRTCRARVGGGRALDVGAALSDLFGRDAVESLFQLDEFPRRFVATVDNLARSEMGARLRPLRPAGGRFAVEHRGGGEVIGSDNELRYTPYVLLLENVDVQRAVAVYARLYPLFQQAYQDLGYPHGYFNDRLVEAIDLLLATPERSAPLRVHLPSLAGSTPPRPWLLYEFDDPDLQSLAAGQKLLLRMGPVNERRVKARLLELRKLLTARAVAR